LELIEGYPVCINDKKVADFLYDTFSDFLGPDKVQFLPPTTGAEDFAYFTQEKPGAMIRLGCGNESKGIIHPLHSAFFDIDEEVLMIGVELFTEAVRRYLG
jgi:amidohydrolase